MHHSKTETWVFSVVSWILCSWFLDHTDWPVNCSRYVAQLPLKICHHLWPCTFYPWRTWGLSEMRWILYSSAKKVVDCLNNRLDNSLWTRLAILNSARSLTGSQWSWCSVVLVGATKYHRVCMCNATLQLQARLEPCPCGAVSLWLALPQHSRPTEHFA